MILAISLASATATTLKGRRAKSAISHRGAFSLPFTPQDRRRATNKERAERRIPHLRYAAEPFLAAARMGLWRQSQPGGEVTAGFESFGIRDQRFDGSRRDAPTHGIVISRRMSSSGFTSPTIPRSSLSIWRVNAWI